MRAYENSISINIHCCIEGDWTQEHINKEQFSEFCLVSWEERTIFFCSRFESGVEKESFELNESCQPDFFK